MGGHSKSNYGYRGSFLTIAGYPVDAFSAWIQNILQDHFRLLCIEHHEDIPTQIKFHLLPAPCLNPASRHRGPSISNPEDKNLSPTVSLTTLPVTPRAWHQWESVAKTLTFVPSTTA